MRVDNNWEDSIGKRLHDFEGELTPQDWNKINQRLQPVPKFRFRWLPLLLCFLSLPVILFLTTRIFKVNHDEEPTITVETPPAKPVHIHEIPVAEKQVKPKNTETDLPENGRVSVPETGPETAFATRKMVNNDGKKIISSPEKSVLIAGTITNTSKNPLVPEEEKPTDKPENYKDTKKVARQVLPTKTANQLAGTLAFHATSENNVIPARKNNQETETTSAEYAAKTVGISGEKPEEQSAIAQKNVQSETTETGAVIDARNQAGTAENSKEIAAIFSRSVALQHAGLAAVTLPDTIKKQLLARLPEPAETNEKKKENKRTSADKNWEFGIYGTPQYTFQRVQPNRNDNVNILKMANKNTIESERFGFEFGARAYYPVRKNLQLTFGLQVANLNQHLQLITQNPLADSAVVVQQGNTITMQVYNRQQRETHLFKYYFGGLFTGANLTVAEKLELHGGLGLNWLLHAKSATQELASETVKINPYLSFGLKYKIPLSYKLHLTAGPTMQYYLKPVQEKQALIGVKPTTFGIMVGLQYKP